MSIQSVIRLNLALVLIYQKIMSLSLGLIFCLILSLNGVLLLFRPKLFLKFYQWQNPGDRWGRNASWKKAVNGTEYKALGAVLLLSGLFFAFLISKVILKRTY